MEDAFFGFEIQVMVGCKLQNVSDGCHVSVHRSASGYSNIIHVDTDCSTKEFMLSYEGCENVVHHGLESCGGVCEAEKHDEGFVKSVACFERCFVLVAFFDTYVVVSPSNVQFSVDVCPL